MLLYGKGSPLLSLSHPVLTTWGQSCQASLDLHDCSRSLLTNCCLGHRDVGASSGGQAGTGVFRLLLDNRNQWQGLREPGSLPCNLSLPPFLWYLLLLKGCSAQPKRLQGYLRSRKEVKRNCITVHISWPCQLLRLSLQATGAFKEKVRLAWS